LDPAREPVVPEDAATLLVLRDVAGGIEVFCVRRHGKSAFMGGVVVFPGGKLDAADGAAHALGNGVHPRAAQFADDAAHASALTICACRESLEEAALLPCDPDIDAAHAERLRSDLTHHADFAKLLRSEGLTLRTADLVPFARWITPEAEARRYDARFFVTRRPAGQEGRHDDHETTSSMWATPARLLEAFHRGDLVLAPPTLRTLELLLPLATVEQAMELASTQSLLPIRPRLVPHDPPMLTLPGDPTHEHDDVRVAGATRFVLRDGKFVSEEPS
jgi:8-oxo-dGTP pyrophosphatase MutT (NUDIX family)